MDDPYQFGEISVANALSDIYAVGAKPLTAMNIVAYPKSLGISVIKDLLRGGATKIKEANAVIVGGQTIDNPQLIYGVAVTSIVDKTKLITTANAIPGDAVILTKKIGTGIISNIRKENDSLLGRLFKKKQIKDSIYNEAILNMKMLNQNGASVMLKHNASSATDVTGYGLLGHLHNIAVSSNVTIKISYNLIPTYDGIIDYAIIGSKGGGRSNYHWTKDKVIFDEDITTSQKMVLNDPQTSGGLLFTLKRDFAKTAVDELKSKGAIDASIIGEVTDSGSDQIIVSR